MTRRTLRRAAIFEAMAVALAEYTVHEGYLATCLSSIRNLVYYVHQNYILTCDAVLAKLSPEAAHNVL